MRILITGGAGFIGSHLADAYIEAGHQVVIFDNLSTGVKDNLNPKAKFYEIDIRDAKAAQILIQEAPDILNHHAAQIRVDLAVKDPKNDVDINILGLVNLMEAAKASKFLKKVILASTGGAMYGRSPIPATEAMIPKPLSPYGISKHTDELLLNFYHEQYGIPYVALRYANVYGPRQNPHGEAGVVSIFCEKLLTGQQPVINGNGKQTRDYVFVADVVKANILATQTEIIGEFNIGTGTETDVNSIYSLISSEIAPTVKANYGPPRPGEQLRSALDASLASAKLGWQPTISLQEGIKSTVEFFKHK